MLKQDELGKNIFGRAFDRVADYFEDRPIQKAAAYTAYAVAAGATAMGVVFAAAETTIVQDVIVEPIGSAMDWADKNLFSDDSTPDVQPSYPGNFEGPYSFDRDFLRYTGSITIKPDNFIAP